MKTTLICLIFALVGVGTAYSINFRRYAQYEPNFGPMDYRGEVAAANAMDVLSQSWDKDSPKVELPDGNIYDFGVMAPGEEGQHVFVVKNVGNADLELKVGASTCKCTVGELGDELLAPGEETEVTMSWTVKTNSSTFGQSAELRTNDPSKVAIRFEISGQVVRQVQLEPESITFGEVAAGETVEVEGKFFTYFDDEVRIGDAKFGDEEIDALADIEITPIPLDPDDSAQQAAKQGFELKAKIKPGLRQGAINQHITVELLNKDAGDEPAESEIRYLHYPVSGRIVGVLSMLSSSRLKGVNGGAYLYTFEKLEEGKPGVAKTFVVLKGEQRDQVQLSVGDTSPSEVVGATLGEPMSRGKMTLFPLEVTLTPQEKQVERLGLNRDDYGYVIVESDNPQVPALKMRLKFSLPAR